MIEFRSGLDETLEGWRDVRDGLIGEVRNIPASKFDFRPAPGVRSVREMVQHILEVAMLATEELTRAETDFSRTPWQELIRKHSRAAARAKTKQQLIALLKSQMKDAERGFRAVGDLALTQTLTRFDGKLGTKHAWLHHAIAQEMYHRGQLATYERLMGIEPALTKRIRDG